MLNYDLTLRDNSSRYRDVRAQLYSSCQLKCCRLNELSVQTTSQNHSVHTVSVWIMKN